MNEPVSPTQPARVNSPRLLQRGETGTPPVEPHNTPRAIAQQATPGQTNMTTRDCPARKRANISIATLNINGASAPTANLNIIDKWTRINSTLRKNKIGILALQETHLNNESIESIERCFGKSFSLHHSSDPENPRTKAGVAIAINKALIPQTDIKLHVLVPGRAIMIQLKWPDDNRLSILNIYAPVKKNEQPEFWADVETERREKHLPRPDFLLGDFNVTEDALDRAPPKFDNRSATDTLREIRLTWEIQDQWRHAHPNQKQYTYRALSNGKTRMSRLDRIYSARKHSQTIFDWKSEPTAVPTDHWLVSLKFAPNDAPLIGNGRWTWFIPSLKEEPLLAEIAKRGNELQERLESLQNGQTTRDETNPQTLWEAFKLDLKEIAKQKADKSHYKSISRMKRLEKDRKEICDDPNFEYDEDARVNESYLASEIKHLTITSEKENREELRALISSHGEKLGGIWSAINKEKKPRDLIRRLKKPNSNPLQYERSTVKMAELAQNYHQTLQTDADPPPTEEERLQQISTALETIPAAQILSNPGETKMNNLLDEGSVRTSLDLTKNGTATGVDGCPYELWKALNKKYDDDIKAGKAGFNIIKVLTIVYRDIQMNGLDERSNFALGWMCPLYKKKDPTEISNYRPITLLNTDYKMLTKALALQLVDEIEQLVHPDQAGFIRNRSILDQIRLMKTIINYAEATEENGAIVALDQEKAYDKIKHDYLWATLEKFEIPHTFTNTVKSLYNNAHTMVAINGVFSEPYKVTRGVRQGDPLSCALFDLAIEPLACSLRSDPRLHGYNIPGSDEKLITSLFADDTSIYLNQTDKMDDVQSILDEWCHASGAKFNIAKTEIIPIGTPEHRNQVIATRKLNPQDQTTIDERIRIAEDGEATRALGAWIGNNTNNATPWEPIIDRAYKNLERWNKSHPTLLGRKLIVQMIIGGYTQFLASAQGMPTHIESALIRMIRNFMWNDSSMPKIALETLYRPVEEGGLNLLDLPTRNEAIEIMWLKAYLHPSAIRPTWARITDILIDAAAPKETNQKARINTFLQTWKPHMRGARAVIGNEDIIRMLKVGRKYQLTFQTIRLAPHLIKQLPAWHHPGTEHTRTKSQTAKCLIEVHEALTIADLIRISSRIRIPPLPRPHTPSAWCNCPECVRDRIKKCKNPHECATEAQKKIDALYPKYNPLIPDENHGDLSLTASRKRENLQASYQNELITFDPSITNKKDLTECFRIFTDPNVTPRQPAQRRVDPRTALRHQTVRIYTDGACLDNGKTNAKCGSGIWVGENDPRNQAIRVPGTEQSNQIGELVAVIKAAQDLPIFTPMEIHSDSKYVIEGLTLHLPNWDDIGWIAVQNAPLFQKAAFLLRRRTATTRFKWVRGHSGDHGNEESDRLAKEGAEKANPDDLDLHIPEEYTVQGAKLSAMTQALAYKGIRLNKTKNTPPITPNLLQRIREAIRALNGQSETDATIWKSLRKPILRTRIQQFLYNSVHQALMVGDVWNHIPNFEYRETCPTCNTTESMEHILTQCNANTNRIIWRLAEETWPHHDMQWPEINIGLIIGIGCLNTPVNNDPQEQVENLRTLTARKGSTRLLQILISESAHLIWVLRCERIIHEEIHSDNEIRTRWLRKINERLTCDRIVATKIVRDKTYTKMVKQTWRKAIQRQNDLPVNWFTNREVLVGSGR